MADDTSTGLMSTLGGLLKAADPTFLMSMGFGLMSGARYGSNAGEGLMQGLNMYQQQKQGQLQQQLMRQQLQSGALGLQRQQMMTNAAQQALQGDQGQPQGPVSSAPGMPPQAPQSAPFLPGISQMPSSGAPSAGMAVPPTAAPQGGALVPPSMSQIYGTTYPGSVSPNYMRAMAMFSQDPAAALLKVREDQLKSAQQSYAPTIAKLDTLIKSDTPSKYMKADSDLMGAWTQLAPTLGLDPQKDYNDQNVRYALTTLRNQFAGSLQEPTEAPAAPWQTRQGPLGSVIQTSPVTGEQKEVVKPEPLKDVLVNGQPAAVRASQAEGRQPFNQVTYGTAQMSGGPGALLAAMAAKGVSLPAGLRSQQQQVATLNGLIAANPGKSPEEIADMVRTGQLDFNGAKRSTAQLATVAAAADAQTRQLEKNFASMEPLVAKMDKTGVPIINRAFAQLRQNWQAGGDSDTSQFMVYLRAVAGEYAKLKSGGTGAAAPAEGEMKDALAVMNNAFSQGGYQGLKTALLTEAQNKRDSYREGIQGAATPGFATGQAPQSPAGNAPVRVKSPQEALALKPGTVFITPDGRTKVR